MIVIGGNVFDEYMRVNRGDLVQICEAKMSTVISSMVAVAALITEMTSLGRNGTSVLRSDSLDGHQNRPFICHYNHKATQIA